MKHGSTLFLKIVLLLIALAGFAALVWFPQAEGRAANLDLISIYTDPIIIYGYIASIPFFVGLYQAFKLLNFIDANKAFSQGAVRTVTQIKYASLSLPCFVLLAILYIRLAANGDDPAGPTALGVIISFVAIVIATAASVFEKLLQKAIKHKLRE